MELRKFKEKNPKKVGIILFTITCILLISGVILYRTFAIFQVNENQNMIEGNIQDEGDIRFMVYVDDVLQKDVPNKESGYSLDTSTSYCDNGSIVSWNDENWEVRLKNVSTTKTKCYLKFKQIYKEGILNGAIPDLMNGRLVPVVILANESPSDVNYVGGSKGGKVEKADITDTDDPWYSYTNKKWANAVILRDGKTDTYKPGEEILESDIESYFVWIPRYKYKLKENEATYDGYSVIKQKFEEKLNNDDIPNTGENSMYEIKFETNKDGIQKGNAKNSWLTHPAFVSFNSNGMWVGKFETGYNGAADILEAAKDERDISKIIIKPNVYSWRNIKVGTAFYNSYDYHRDLESHMMKNSEWGAVFYLTQSKYGKCTEKEGNTTCEEVRINNGNYVTGYSAKNKPICGYTETNEECNKYESVSLNQDGSYGYSYYNISSQLASTTGNYYGIYDMAGSAWEYVMGVMQAGEKDARPATGPNSDTNSGFKGPYSSNIEIKEEGLEWPSSLYYDLYNYDTSNQQYQRGQLGDATKELGPFYSVTYNYGFNVSRYVSSYFAGISHFVNSELPWFVRGADFMSGSGAGVGVFGRDHGSANNVSFRIILTP